MATAMVTVIKTESADTARQSPEANCRAKAVIRAHMSLHHANTAGESVTMMTNEAPFEV